MGGQAEGETDWIGPSLAASDLNGDGRVTSSPAPQWSARPRQDRRDGRAFRIFGAAELAGVRDLLPARPSSRS
jgi:hypothetical protein